MQLLTPSAAYTPSWTGREFKSLLILVSERKNAVILPPNPSPPSPTLPFPPCPRPFTLHETAIYSRNRGWLHLDTMYVTSPPIPLTLFISYDCDAKDDRFTVVGLDPGEDFDEVREAFFFFFFFGIEAQRDPPAA